MVDIKFLIEAIRKNNIEDVKELVEHGADVDYFDGSNENIWFYRIRPNFIQNVN